MPIWHLYATMKVGFSIYVCCTAPVGHPRLLRCATPSAPAVLSCACFVQGAPTAGYLGQASQLTLHANPLRSDNAIIRGSHANICLCFSVITRLCSRLSALATPALQLETNS